MLGNWSFGDYFKEGAINFAWELLTQVYKLDPSRLYATYFEGSEEDGVPCDNEAFAIWKTHLPEDHILKGNKHVVLCFPVQPRTTSGRWEKWVLAVRVWLFFILHTRFGDPLRSH